MKQPITCRWLDFTKKRLDAFPYVITPEYIFQEYINEIISPHQTLVVVNGFSDGILRDIFRRYPFSFLAFSYPLIQKIRTRICKKEGINGLETEIYGISSKVQSEFFTDFSVPLAEDMNLTSSRGVFSEVRELTSSFEILKYKGELIRIPTNLLGAIVQSTLQGLYEPKEDEFTLDMYLTVELYRKKFVKEYSEEFLKTFSQMLKKEGDLKKILFVWDKFSEE